jgi:hypothetical protein
MAARSRRTSNGRPPSVSSNRTVVCASTTLCLSSRHGVPSVALRAIRTDASRPVGQSAPGAAAELLDESEAPGRRPSSRRARHGRDAAARSCTEMYLDQLRPPACAQVLPAFSTACARRNSVGLLRLGRARPPTEVIVAYIDAHPSAWSRADLPRPDRRRKPDRPEHLPRRDDPSAVGRSVNNAVSTGLIEPVHADNCSVYCARKVHPTAVLGAPDHPLHRPAPDAAGRAPEQQPSQGTARHRAGQRPGHSPGPGRPRLPSRHTRPPLGCRNHLLPYLRRLGLRRVHHRRLQPPRRGLAPVDQPAHRPGARRPEVACGCGSARTATRTA